jgi:hypothetical protein
MRPAWHGAVCFSMSRGKSTSPNICCESSTCWLWHKLNRFHLHLSDDEGWRLDIPSYPQLAKLAGWRGHGLPIPPLLGSPSEPYGIIYSRQDIARLTRRAEQLFITIVPEIDIPGHGYCVLQAIPELRDPSETGMYRSIQNSADNVLNPAVRETYDFLEAVFDEVARMFPSPWIHVGGDEVPGDAWRGSREHLTILYRHADHSRSYDYHRSRSDGKEFGGTQISASALCTGRRVEFGFPVSRYFKNGSPAVASCAASSRPASAWLAAATCIAGCEFGCSSIALSAYNDDSS